MATVKKCDICQAIYDVYPDKPLAYISVCKKLDGLSGVLGNNEIDCCPECTEKLMGFIDVLKTYGNRYCIDILNELED